MFLISRQMTMNWISELDFGIDEENETELRKRYSSTNTTD